MCRYLRNYSLTHPFRILAKRKKDIFGTGRRTGRDGSRDGQGKSLRGAASTATEHNEERSPSYVIMTFATFARSRSKNNAMLLLKELSILCDKIMNRNMRRPSRNGLLLRI